MIYLAPIIAFLLGSIPFGLLIAKTQGINIREPRMYYASLEKNSALHASSSISSKASHPSS